MITYKLEEQDGYKKYVELFGSYEIPELPPVIDIDCFRELPSFFCVELGQYLGDCAKKNERATMRGYVDALYLRDDGVYSFENVAERDFDRFIERVSAFDYNI